MLCSCCKDDWQPGQVACPGKEVDNPAGALLEPWYYLIHIHMNSEKWSNFFLGGGYSFSFLDFSLYWLYKYFEILSFCIIKCNYTSWCSFHFLDLSSTPFIVAVMAHPFESYSNGSTIRISSSNSLPHITSKITVIEPFVLASVMDHQVLIEANLPGKEVVYVLSITSILQRLPVFRAGVMGNIQYGYRCVCSKGTHCFTTSNDLRIIWLPNVFC